jgi:hypothetical protein
MPVEGLFKAVMKKRPAGEAPYVNIEQDNAVAGVGRSLAEPISDPAKSLRDARTDYLALAALKS